MNEQTEKLIKIELSENTKSVVGAVKIEYRGTNTPSNEEVIKESKELFEQVTAYTYLKTKEKSQN